MKRSYHSDIIIQYQLGMLSGEMEKQIPTSTRNNWKSRDPQKLFGLGHVHNFQDRLELMKSFMNNRKLLKAAKALYQVHMTYISVVHNIRGRKKVFREQKKTILNTIDNVKNELGQKRALRAFGISSQQYYAWKRKIECKLTPQILCRKNYPTQLTDNEVKTIKSYLNEPRFANWNVTNIYFQILREKAAFFSQTTFYKYVNKFQLNRPKIKKKRHPIGIRATKAKQILHMDVTIYKPLDHSKVFLYFLVDNYSRYILSWKASLKYNANIAFQNIKEAYYKHNLQEIIPDIELITDGGSENKGEVDRFVNSPEINIQKYIAQSDIIYSNSMVEAVNKRMKYDFLFREKLLDIHHVISFLKKAVPEYHIKPHSGLYSLTPQEVLNGMIPDKNMYTEAIKMAAQQRVEINMQQNCLNCPPE